MAQLELPLHQRQQVGRQVMNRLVEEHRLEGGSAHRTNHMELLDLMLEFLSGNQPGA